jgi:uncharacterized protein (TIGR02058 family)
MALKRYVTEMGMGTDVHGGDYTKAARRAVSDAIRHSSLNFFRVLKKSPDDMKITVRIGVQEPDKLDTAAIAAEFPYGDVTVVTVVGGLDVPEEAGAPGEPGIDKLVIANAAVLVCFEEESGRISSAPADRAATCRSSARCRRAGLPGQRSGQRQSPWRLQ